MIINDSYNCTTITNTNIDNSYYYFHCYYCVIIVINYLLIYVVLSINVCTISILKS